VRLLELALCGDGGGLSFDSKLYRTALARQATDIADGLEALEEMLEAARPDISRLGLGRSLFAPGASGSRGSSRRRAV